MGIFDFILRKKVKVVDDFFGEMTFIEFKKNPEKNYFECRRYFKPIDEIIEIGVNGDVTSLFELQKDFFQQIESNYDEIVLSVKPLIEDEFRNWKEDFEIVDFRKEFKAVYIFLSISEKEPKVWELSFESIHDLNHTINLTMSDFNATEIFIDG